MGGGGGRGGGEGIYGFTDIICTADTPTCLGYIKGRCKSLPPAVGLCERTAVRTINGASVLFTRRLGVRHVTIGAPSACFCFTHPTVRSSWDAPGDVWVCVA